MRYEYTISWHVPGGIQYAYALVTASNRREARAIIRAARPKVHIFGGPEMCPCEKEGPNYIWYFRNREIYREML